MTEVEWLACADPMPMLALLRGKGQRSKLLRFVAAILRRHPPLLAWRSPRVLEVVERCADAGQVSPTEWGEACRLLASGPMRGYWRQVTEDWDRGEADEVDVAALIAEAPQDVKDYPGRAWAAEQQWQADLLRCVFGNLFRPVRVEPSRLAWREGTVVQIARTIEADQALDRLPILADALEEAGCTDPDILRHCRGPGPHAHGCWVVDLLLGKT
jgi:hypothetical protein